MRYTIQNPAGALYSDNTVPETRYEPIPGNPSVAAPRSLLVPVFGSLSGANCLKYETLQEAQDMLAHPDLMDPVAFDGCNIAEVEFDPFDRGAVRAVPVNF